MPGTDDYNDDELEEEITGGGPEEIDDGYDEGEGGYDKRERRSLSDTHEDIERAKKWRDRLKKRELDAEESPEDETGEPERESESKQTPGKEPEKGGKPTEGDQPSRQPDELSDKELPKDESTDARVKGETLEGKTPSGELKGEVGRPIGTPKTPPAGGAGGTGVGVGTADAAGGTGAAASGTAGAAGGTGAAAGGTGAAAGGTGAAAGGTATVGTVAWWVILIIIALLLILAIILFFLGIIVGFFTGGSSSDSTGSISSVPVGHIVGGVENTIPYPSGCDEQAMVRSINLFIDRHTSGSPLSGQGHLFVQAGREGGINPFFIAAQANKENQFATTGYARNHPGSYNTFGHKYGAWTKDYGTVGGRSPEGDHYMSYPNWESSLRAHTNIITHYINDRGKRTLLEIIDYYMTGNEVVYTNQVNQWMSEMFANAGCSPSTGVSTIPGTSVDNTSIESMIKSSGFSSDDVSYAIVGNSGSTSNNADRMMASASSIKASILLAYLYNNNVPSKGSSIDSSIDKMIINSNNESANQVINSAGGIGQVSSTLASHGITGVSLNRSFGASSTKDNLISANGAIASLRAITQLPTEKREYALDKLYKGDTGSGQDYIRKSLTGAIVYSKSGQGLNSSARNDIAIVQNGDNYSFIAVLVRTNSGNTAKAQALIGEIAKRGIVIADSNAGINCY